MRSIIIKPFFDSELFTLIVEIERLCAIGKAPLPESPLFDDLRRLFFVCESVWSARIEGNHTTVAQYVEAVREGAPNLLTRESYREIANLDETLRWIETVVGDEKITEAFVRELHRRAVDGLNALDGEGDLTPGEYRREPVRILNATHEPPNPGDVAPLMRDFLDWLDEDVRPQQELLRIALAHWRLVWIHPFRNGNGRVARLLTYALLVKRGFFGRGLILNPTAICCQRRTEYYNRLGEADRAYARLQKENASNDAIRGLENWCSFLLGGLKQELESTARLLNRDFIVKEIVVPALDRARRYEKLLPIEVKTALATLRLGRARVGDVVKELKGESSQTAIRQAWRSLRDKGLLTPLHDNGRVYRFTVGWFLYPSIIERFEATNLTKTPLK